MKKKRKRKIKVEDSKKFVAWGIIAMYLFTDFNDDELKKVSKPNNLKSNS